jgi:hypothetical protein
VREALGAEASAIEEGKADVLGLYMITRLIDTGALAGSIDEHYVTFMAGIFRSVRFGAASAHGRANLVRFNYFEQARAFTRDSASGTYRVDVAAMRRAVDALSEELLRLQGDGDQDRVRAFAERLGRPTPELERDLAGLASAGIPVDVVFEQGPAVLGLAAAGGT